MVIIDLSNYNIWLENDFFVSLEYFKTLSPYTFNEPEGIYIYLEEIYPEHESILSSFNIRINTKDPINLENI